VEISYSEVSHTDYCYGMWGGIKVNMPVSF